MGSRQNQTEGLSLGAGVSLPLAIGAFDSLASSLLRRATTESRFVVRADEKLTAFLEPEVAIRVGGELV